MQGDDVRGDGRGWSGGRVVVVVRLEWEGGGNGWMSGVECMEINCFLGDNALMIR